MSLVWSMHVDVQVHNIIISMSVVSAIATYVSSQGVLHSMYTQWVILSIAYQKVLPTFISQGLVCFTITPIHTITLSTTYHILCVLQTQYKINLCIKEKFSFSEFFFSSILHVLCWFTLVHTL